MQDADEREQGARGCMVNCGYGIKAFAQQARPFIVQAAAGHVDGFKACAIATGVGRLIAFANHEVVFHEFAEGREREGYIGQFLAQAVAHAQMQAVAVNADTHVIGPARIAFKAERVAGNNIADGGCAFGFHKAVAPDEQFFVQFDFMNVILQVYRRLHMIIVRCTQGFCRVFMQGCWCYGRQGSGSPSSGFGYVWP